MALQHQHSSHLGSLAVAAAISLCSPTGTSVYAQNSGRADPGQITETEGKCTSFYINTCKYNLKGMEFLTKNRITQDDLTNALHQFNLAINEDGKDSISYANRGLVYGMMGDNQKALADFDNAISINPQNAIAYKNRGTIKNRIADYKGAAADFNKALQIKDNDWKLQKKEDIADTRMGLGKAEYLLKDYNSAMADLNEAISMVADDADYYIQRGAVWRDMGNSSKAVADFDMALKLEPNNALARSLRSEISSQTSIPSPSEGHAAPSNNNSDNALKDMLGLEPRKPKPPNFKNILDPPPNTSK